MMGNHWNFKETAFDFTMTKGFVQLGKWNPGSLHIPHHWCIETFAKELGTK